MSINHNKTNFRRRHKKYTIKTQFKKMNKYNKHLHRNNALKLREQNKNHNVADL